MVNLSCAIRGAARHRLDHAAACHQRRRLTFGRAQNPLPLPVAAPAGDWPESFTTTRVSSLTDWPGGAHFIAFPKIDSGVSSLGHETTREEFRTTARVHTVR